MSTLTLRLTAPVANFPVSRLNGPGDRWVLWVQGCSLRCTRHCLNPDYLTAEGGHLVPVAEVVAELDRVCGRCPTLEGVTFLGGEPFDQAAALAVIAHAAQTRGLSVMTYTGWVHERLRAAGPPGTLELLAECDLVVDGPFVDARANPELRWRGSDNQRILLLSDRYSAEQIQSEPVVKGLDVHLRDGQTHISGAQNPQLLHNVLLRLRAAGFAVRPESEQT